MSEHDGPRAGGTAGGRAGEVRALVEECLRRVEDEGSAVFEEVCARRPDLAPAVRERLHMLHAAGLLAPDADDGRGQPDAIPERLGEFRLLARLGGGGMGVVYLAEQTSLQRRVALKLVRPAHLFFPGARERFRREAEAVARLAHPGIVPIYTVGEESDVPYFAMECVRGATLAEVLAELHPRAPASLTGRDLQLAVTAIVARREGVTTPGLARDPRDPHDKRAAGAAREARDTRAPGAARDPRVGRGSDSFARTFAGNWVEACLRLVAQAAAALQHAHERGVLHRDVKPSNLMLTPDGRVLLFDFGLAAAEGASRITRSGSQLGSLAYMSPEQVRGELSGLDARSDVYALGVTLYELLALATPYAADDEQQLRAAILDGRPTLLRARNPAVPRDAETVCQAAMEADRARRYASAAEFAHDLDNVLERRPIAARRPGPLLRARRFVQRHPAGSTALVLGSLLVVGGPLAWGLWERRANVGITAALDEARRQGEEAARQRDAARLDLARAMAAVDTMLTRVGDEALANVPQVGPVRRQLLDDALGFYRELLASHSDVPALRQAAALTARRIGELALVAADWDTARSAFGLARTLFAELVEDEPQVPVHLTELGDTWMGLGQLELEFGAEAAAQAANAQARELFLRRLAVDPHDTRTRSSLASVTNSTGTRLQREGHQAEAEAPLREALAQLVAIVEELPDDPENQRRVGFLLNNLGGLMRSLDRTAEAEEFYLEAERRYAVGVGLAPDDRLCRQELAGVRQNFAGLLRELGRPAEADALYAEALASHRELVSQFPDSMDNLAMLASCASSRGVFLIQAARLHDAEALLGEAVAAQERVVAATPESPEMRARLALALANASEAWSRDGRATEARPLLERAMAEQQIALQRMPGQPGWQSALRTQHLRLSAICRELRDWDAAQAATEAYLADPPGNGTQLRRAAGLYAELAAAIRATGEDGAADGTGADGAAGTASAAGTADTAGAARADALRATAIDVLRRAIDAGFRDGADLAGAADLATLRELPEFAVLAAACESATP